MKPTHFVKNFPYHFTDLIYEINGYYFLKIINENKFIEISIQNDEILPLNEYEIFDDSEAEIFCFLLPETKLIGTKRWIYEEIDNRYEHLIFNTFAEKISKIHLLKRLEQNFSSRKYSLELFEAINENIAQAKLLRNKSLISRFQSIKSNQFDEFYSDEIERVAFAKEIRLPNEELEKLPPDPYRRGIIREEKIPKTKSLIASIASENIELRKIKSFLVSDAFSTLEKDFINSALEATYGPHDTSNITFFSNLFEKWVLLCEDDPTNFERYAVSIRKIRKAFAPSYNLEPNLLRLRFKFDSFQDDFLESCYKEMLMNLKFSYQQILRLDHNLTPIKFLLLPTTDLQRINKLVDLVYKNDKSLAHKHYEMLCDVSLKRNLKSRFKTNYSKLKRKY